MPSIVESIIFLPQSIARIKFVLPDAFAPVSYTHLDVYKRQAIGFALIKLAAFMILSGRIAGEEIGSLLTEAPDGTKKQLPSAVYALALLAGAALLAAAYTMAICGFSWNNVAHRCV